MAKLPPITVAVRAIRDISANMKRITFGGDSLAAYPAGGEGRYIKLFLDTAGQENPSVRTYTIRNHRPRCLEIDVDFVMHGDHGVASAWAHRAKVGDTVTVGGPGPGKMVDTSADWFFLVGDMTALPALSVNLEALPESAVGYAVVEVIDDCDQQELKAPPGMEIHWVRCPPHEKGAEWITNYVRERSWLEGRPSVWAASEFETMRALRRYFKSERGLPKSDVYVSSYWKNGLREDEHKVVKKRDAETV